MSVIDRNVAVLVPISQLLPGDSPRLSGESVEHATALAESGAVLPPVVVHRTTMRVIDGMHRIRAALLRGRHAVEVCYFDGTEDDAFAFAVEANMRHGLPLSLADRAVAAKRIIGSHPHWSDRRIAAVAGLSPKTVGAIRGRPSADADQLASRVGRDGRARPVDPARGRRIAGELLARQPDASLRAVARQAGVSPETVRDVRMRLLRDEDPVPHQARAREQEPTDDLSGVLRHLKSDPSVRHSDGGRQLIRFLEVAVAASAERGLLVDSVPEHWKNEVVRTMRECAGVLSECADRLAQRTAAR